MTQLRSMPIPTRAVPSAAPTREGDVESGEVLDVLSTLWRGKFLIFAAILIATALGALYCFRLAVPVYTSDAVLVLDLSADQPVPEMPEIGGALFGEDSEVNTEVEILRSRGMMTELVRALDLTKDPEFNPALQPPMFPFLADLGLLADDAPRSEESALQATVIELFDAVSVSNIRDTTILQIWVTTESPEKSALIANTLMNLYVERRISRKFDALERTDLWLTGQVADLKAKLAEAETALQDFSMRTDLVGVESLAALNRNLKELRDRHAGSLAKAEELAARRARLESIAGTASPQEIAAVAGDQGLIEGVDRLQAGVITQQAFATLVDRHVQQLGTLAAREREQAASLARAVADMERTVEHQASELVRQQQLEREVAATAFVYETLLARLKQVSTEFGSDKTDARVVSVAPVPDEPSAPKPELILPMTAMLGAFAGVGLLLGRARMQNTFRTAEELERLTGETVLGEIPVAPTRQRRKLLAYVTSKRQSAFAEAVRDLRTSIIAADLEQAPKVIMVTSSIAGEGKTTQALSLTHNFSALGKRVLLIEADIRRQPVADYLDLPAQRPGLEAAVIDDTETDYLVHSDALQADVILGGKSQANAADFFSSKGFAELVASARASYDVVIIDTPPVLIVPDARVIGRLADAILYVVRWDHTTKYQVTRGLRSLARAHLQVTGLVLNQVSPKAMKRFGYGGRATGASNYYVS